MALMDDRILAGSLRVAGLCLVFAQPHSFFSTYGDHRATVKIDIGLNWLAALLAKTGS